jgi:hypothetical protein
MGLDRDKVLRERCGWVESFVFFMLFYCLWEFVGGVCGWKHKFFLKQIEIILGRFWDCFQINWENFLWLGDFWG